MSSRPVICFGQQPCGFFPRRFLVAKIRTARRLQEQIGGELVFFYHDSDHDPRETQTTLRHRRTGEPLTLNFAFENKVQRKFSPLYLKRVPAGWREQTARRLPAYVEERWIEEFHAVEAGTVADFCLEMYRRLGLLDGIRIARSSDPELRRAACDVADFFVDLPSEGEIVRARIVRGVPSLHHGGEVFTTLPPVVCSKEQISPARDTRWRWMQSVIHSTHYVAGAGEQSYLDTSQAPGVTFVARETIDRSDEAYVP